MVEISRAFDETDNFVHINETSRYGKFYFSNTPFLKSFAFC
jgi:hypothetical protein